MENYLAAIAGPSRDDPIAKAQDVMYEAWDRATSRSRIALAHKTLTISPLCADAYNLLAEEAGSVQEARDLYFKGIEAGELALGTKRFEQYAGHFWASSKLAPTCAPGQVSPSPSSRSLKRMLPSATSAPCWS
jgi:hypothetical protein